MYRNFRKIEIPGALGKNVTAHNIYLFAKKSLATQMLLLDPDGKLKETEIFSSFFNTERMQQFVIKCIGLGDIRYYTTPQEYFLQYIHAMPTLLSQYMMSILFKGQLISKENFGVHKSTKKQL